MIKCGIRVRRIFSKRNDVRANDTAVTIKLLGANDRKVKESFTSAQRVSWNIRQREQGGKKKSSIKGV